MSEHSPISTWQTQAKDGSSTWPVRLGGLETPVAETTMAFSLLYCHRGSIVFEVDGQARPLVAASLLPLNRGRKLSSRFSDGAQGWRLDFSPSYLNNNLVDEVIEAGQEPVNHSTQQDLFMLFPFLEQGKGPAAVYRPGFAAESRFAELFRLIGLQLAEQPGFWPCRVRTYLLEIILLLANASKPTDQPPVQLPQPGDWGLAEQTLLAIQMNYGSDLSLDNLARLVNSNRTTVNQCFHQRYGTTVHGYLRTYRLEVAELLLRDSFLPVQEIMERVGWTNASSFTRSFREVWGSPPGEYRRLNSQLA